MQSSEQLSTFFYSKNLDFRTFNFEEPTGWNFSFIIIKTRTVAPNTVETTLPFVAALQQCYCCKWLDSWINSMQRYDVDLMASKREPMRVCSSLEQFCKEKNSSYTLLFNVKERQSQRVSSRRQILSLWLRVPCRLYKKTRSNNQRWMSYM